MSWSKDCRTPRNLSRISRRRRRNHPSRSWHTRIRCPFGPSFIRSPDTVPEYQALLWAKENNARVEFIDLPSDIFLAFQDVEDDLRKRARAEAEHDEPNAEEPGEGIEEIEVPVSIYEQIAKSTGEPDYETYWERQFEHNTSDHSYRLAATQLGQVLRELEEDRPRWRAENLVREAFMRRRVETVIAEGNKPEKIVAIVGAFHAPVLSGEFPAMTDDELKRLPRRSSKLTLMPYSYFKLSTQSGYGAGNMAPAYFELLWEALEEGDIHELPNPLSLTGRPLDARERARIARPRK